MAIKHAAVGGNDTLRAAFESMQTAEGGAIDALNRALSDAREARFRLARIRRARIAVGYLIGESPPTTARRPRDWEPFTED
jgi:hypothetical protein